LLDKISALLASDKEHEARFLIFDFLLVNGIDSSASFSFIRLQQLLSASRLQLIFTGCSESLLVQLKQQEVIDASSSIIVLPDLDQGLEWCESRLLADMPDEMKPKVLSISSMLGQLIAEKSDQEIFVKYLERKEIAAEEHLFKQGDWLGCLYFIVSGEVSVFLESDHLALRLSKSGAGTIVGEIGFYLHRKRSATVRAETDCVVYRLTEEAMAEIEKLYPTIALSFHRSIVRVLALRVIQTNYELQVVSQ